MLEARSLTKYYNRTAAIRDVSFTIQPGEILGYLGSNGAGKSTTVKILTGMIEPSDGRVFYRDRTVRDDFTAFQRSIGYVPEEAHLYPHLSGREYLQLVGRLRGIPRQILEPKMDEFLRLFGLGHDRNDALSSYSKGMRQKILLSAALLHNPEVLILDEPFSGLDVNAALMLRSLLRGLAGQGKIILYSSHVLEVVEKVCSKVLILRKGEVVAYDSIDRLRELMSQPSLEGVFAQLTEAGDTSALADEILDVMNFHPSPSVGPVALSQGLYNSIAGAFPHEFQNVYGAELAEVTETAIEPIWRRHGWLGLLRLLWDVAIRVPIEHCAELRQDIRYGLRALMASRGFSFVALVSLSLGICIATCAFSEMNGMLRSIPGVPHPEELVVVQSPVSYPQYRRFREQSDVFSSTMAYAAPVPFTVSRRADTERIWGHLVSTSYFMTLGVNPALGSFFDPSEEHTGQAPIVVVSQRFWRDRLGKNPLVIGSALQINGQPVTIVGVAPDHFLGASPVLFTADLWMPASTSAKIAPELADNALERRDLKMFFVAGRMKPGVSISQAEAQLDTIARQFDRERVEVDNFSKGLKILLAEGGRMFPLRKQDVPSFTSFLSAIASLIMLIACTNVANVMLARATLRRREMAVRLAVGASRARLIRQLLTESIVLSLIAGAAGFIGSTWLMNLGSQVRMPFPMPIEFDFRPDGSVLLLTFLVSLGTGLIFGLAPALQATKTDLTQALNQSGNLFFDVRRGFNFRKLLIVGQIAGSLILLVVLGIMSFGIQTTLGVQSGFDPTNLYFLSMDPARDGYTGERAGAFFDHLIERVRALPSVKAAALTETVPVSLGGVGVVVSAPTGRVVVSAVQHVVGEGYFDVAGIPLLAGRGFNRQDGTEAASRVILSDAMARRLWDQNGSLGRSIVIGDGELAAPKILPGTFDHRPSIPAGERRSFEIIGVAGDVAEGLVAGTPRPVVYFPLRPYSYAHPSLQGVTLMVRSAPGSDALTPIRQEIAAIDPAITPFDARSMTEQIDRFMAPLRIGGWTYGVVALFGLVLVSVGLAGVTAYAVAQRRREIGVRLALGARSRDVVSLMMREGLLLVAAGTILGIAGAWGASRLLFAMNSSVYQVSSTSTSDLRVLIGAPLLVAFIALAACYFPAQKSTRIDPATALRQE